MNMLCCKEVVVLSNASKKAEEAAALKKQLLLEANRKAARAMLSQIPSFESVTVERSKRIP
jgi:hypothetical protein